MRQCAASRSTAATRCARGTTSPRRICRIVRIEQSRGIHAKRIMLAGFSQGGAIALYAALRYPERFAGVIALSTYLIDAASLKAEASEANKDVPIFMAHGTQDTVVRLQWAD